MKRSLNRRGALCSSIVAMAALVVAACSSSTSSHNSGSGSTFSYAVPSGATSLDTAAGAVNPWVTGVRQSTLLVFDPTETCSNVTSAALLRPSGLTKSFTSTDNGKKLKFVLNPGVESQTGHELTSADVKWSFDRILAFSPVGKVLLTVVGGYNAKTPVTITGKYSFDLNVDKPTSLSAEVLTTLWFEILDSATVKAHITSSDKWGGTYLTSHIADFGPWQLAAFTSGSSTTYTRNPNAKGYSGNIKSVVIRGVSDSSVATQLLQSGQVTRADGLNFDQYSTVRKSTGVTVSDCKTATQDFLGLDLKDPKFASAAVRRAISLGLDRTALVSSVYRGFAQPATQAVLGAPQSASTSSNYRFDVTLAKQLLAQAGYPKGFGFTLSYATAPTPYMQPLAVFIQSQLAKIGVKVTLQPTANPTDFRTALAKKTTAAYLLSQEPIFPNAGFSWLIQNGAASAQNFGQVNLPQVDTVAAKIQSEDQQSPSGQTDLASLSTLLNNQMPVVYLANVGGPVAYRTCAKDAAPSAFVNYPLLGNANITC